MFSRNSGIEAFAGIVIASILLVWVVLSAAQYVPRIARAVIRFDYLQLIPQWTFFAPVPNRADYFLYVRVQTGALLSPWREINLAQERTWYAFIWNPGRRIRKGFFDLTVELSRLSTQLREEVIISLPYLHLLTIATAAVATAPGEQVQFAIGQLIPAEPQAQVGFLFCSELHSIAPAVDKL